MRFFQEHKRMRGSVLTLLIILSAAAPPQQPPKKAGNAAAKEFAALSGAWQVQATNQGEHGSNDVCSLLYGRKTKVADQNDPTEILDLFIQSGKFGFGVDRPNRFCTVTLDPTATPKRFDLTIAKGKVVKGIYRYDDDGLYLCFGDENRRPTKDDPIDVHDIMVSYHRKQSR